MQTILYFENGCLRITLDFLTSLFWECLYIGWECLYIGLVSVHWLRVSVHWLSVCTLAECLYIGWPKKVKAMTSRVQAVSTQESCRTWTDMLTIHYIDEWNTLWGRGLTEVLVHSLTKESQGDDVTQRSKLSGLWTLPFLRTAHTLDQHLQYSTKL